jgi:hypothetical protein
MAERLTRPANRDRLHCCRNPSVAERPAFSGSGGLEDAGNLEPDGGVAPSSGCVAQERESMRFCGSVPAGPVVVLGGAMAPSLVGMQGMLVGNACR